MQEAVRALKRRTAELEQQLAHARSAQAAAASQAQGGGQQAAALQQCERQLAEARQQCEQYGARLAQMEGQLRKAEFERAQFEWRAQVRLGAMLACLVPMLACLGCWRRVAAAILHGGCNHPVPTSLLQQHAGQKAQQAGISKLTSPKHFAGC